MRRVIRTVFALYAIGLASVAKGTLHPEADSPTDAADACHHHLHALVAYHRETARLEGTSLLVEWRRDGSVVLRYADFSQFMWCQDGALHIGFGGQRTESPDN